jgi:FAD/FMN-containing dehydrogenase
MSYVADQAKVDEAALRQLEASFNGQLVRPSDATYDEHRKVWNGSIDRRPALIARCVDAFDVAEVIRFARRGDLPLAVRGGGHSFPGNSTCDGGVIADLRPMSQVRVEPDAHRVRVGAGTLLGELDQATQEHGLAVPAGIVTHTGVAGLTLGGGIGWIMRKHGLTVDQLE